jgi:hypothetical protein
MFVAAAVALPQNVDPGTEDPGLPTPQGVHRIFISKSCSSTEQTQITESFNDAKKLANALNSWVPTGKNQDVLNAYMGKLQTHYSPSSIHIHTKCTVLGGKYGRR